MSQLNQMKKISLLLTSILFCTIIHAQSTNKEEQAVQQAVENMFTALTGVDTVALKTLVTTDVRFYEYGEAWPLDTLIKLITQSASTPGFKRTNQFQFVKTVVRNETAWVTYYLQSEITRNGKKELVKWMETVVLVKQKEQWKIQLLHSSLISRT